MNDWNPSKAHARDERLRRLLREADPAAGMEGLQPEEIAAMRRAMLNAVGVKRPPFAWRVPALAAAALAALALAGILWLRGNGSAGGEMQAAAPVQPALQEPPAVLGPQAPRLAQAPEARPAPHAPLLAQGPQARPNRSPLDHTAAPAMPHPDGIARSRNARRSSPLHRSSSSEGERLARNATPPPAATAVEAAVRELQFSTPGGTRVVWVFSQDDPSTSRKSSPRPSRL